MSDSHEIKVPEDRDSLARLKGLEEAERELLNSVRFSDEDQSSKAGSVLTFTGLIIASSIVQLTTEDSSPINVSHTKILVASLGVGLLALFVSSFCSLMSLVHSGKYSRDPQEALYQFEKTVNLRRRYLSASIITAFFGTILVLMPLGWCLVDTLLRP